MSNHQVYFVQTKINGSKHVKIGFTKDMDQRLQALKTSSPGDLWLMGSIKCKSEYSARYLEESLHEMFACYRVAGEWFKLKNVLFDFIVAAVNLDEDALEEVLRTAKYRMAAVNASKREHAEAKAKYGGEWLKPKTATLSRWGSERGSPEYYKTVVKALSLELEKIRAELCDLRAENAVLKSRVGIVSTVEKETAPTRKGAAGGGSGVVVPVPLEPRVTSI